MSKYLNGLFASRKEGQYGEIISIGITEEGLKALQELDKSASGFRNFTLTPQKADNNKFSAKPFVARNTSGGSDGDDSALPF